jgi:hypothetical protein
VAKQWLFFQNQDSCFCSLFWVRPLTAGGEQPPLPLVDSFKVEPANERIFLSFVINIRAKFGKRRKKLE